MKNIVFHGRNDHQFKVSGHRVEAAEIEAAIVSFSNDISWCVVSAQTEQSGNTKIIAFIEYKQHSSSCSASSSNSALGNRQATISALRKHCLQHLPAYMVPDEFNLQQHLPRNISGKVDIKALLSGNHSDNNNYNKSYTNNSSKNKETI